jgi:tetratricopeptide (TPR) repeat protein
LSSRTIAPNTGVGLPHSDTTLEGGEASGSEGTPSRGADGRPAAGIFEHARAILRAGNHEYACQLLRNCCRLEPGNVAYRQALRRALKGQFPDGEGGWLRRLGVWAARARLLLASRAGLHHRVLDYGEEVLAREPRDVGARLEMAAAAEGLGMTTLAQWLLEDAWRLEPRNVPVQRALAQLHEQEGEIERAVALWEAVARLDPSDLEASLRAKNLVAAIALAQALGAHEACRKPGRESCPR